MFDLPTIIRAGNGLFQCRLCSEPQATRTQIQRHLLSHFLAHEIAQNIDLRACVICLCEERQRRSNLPFRDCFAEFILSVAEGLAMTKEDFSHTLSEKNLRPYDTEGFAAHSDTGNRPAFLAIKRRSG